MRAFMMIAAGLVAFAAHADPGQEVRPERVDTATAADRGEDGAGPRDRSAGKASAGVETTRSDSTGQKAQSAQDYNSSRSNNSSAVAPAPGGGHNASRSNRSHASSAAPAQDYNSSRSNNGSAGVALHDDDDDGDGLGDASRAQNHNSSRSNRTQPACRAGVDDDCDDTDRSASPAGHNTTRSNR